MGIKVLEYFSSQLVFDLFGLSEDKEGKDKVKLMGGQVLGGQRLLDTFN